MAKVKQAGKKSDAMSGLKMVGGAAAGAAAGSLIGPIGAAVGAVVGGIAGANAKEIADSKPVKSLMAATKKKIAKPGTTKAVPMAVTNPRVTKAPKKAATKSSAAKKPAKRKK